MAKRDIVKTAEKAQIADGYALRSGQVTEIMNHTGGDWFGSLALAFEYGYVMGGRAALAGKYKEKE